MYVVSVCEGLDTCFGNSGFLAGFKVLGFGCCGSMERKGKKKEEKKYMLLSATEVYGYTGQTNRKSSVWR